jgi:hypothetical protein
MQTTAISKEVGFSTLTSCLPVIRPESGPTIRVESRAISPNGTSRQRRRPAANNPARPTCGMSSKYGATVQLFLESIKARFVENNEEHVRDTAAPITQQPEHKSQNA